MSRRRCVVETLSNIRSTQCILALSDGEKSADVMKGLVIRGDGLYDANDGGALVAPFEFEADPAGAHILNAGAADSLTVRVPWAASAQTPLRAGSVTKDARSSSLDAVDAYVKGELGTLMQALGTHGANVACRGCGAVVVRGGAVRRALPMPSEGWEELADAWVCHKEDYSKYHNGAIASRRGLLLVGVSYCMAHTGDVERAAVCGVRDGASTMDGSVSDNGATEAHGHSHWHGRRRSSERWRLSCVRCSALLGACDGDVQRADVESSARLYKHAIALQSGDGTPYPDDPLLHHTMSSFFALEMLQRSRDSASFRFALTPSSSPSSPSARTDPLALLWVMNWNMGFWASPQNAAADGSLTARRVFKVLYIDCTRTDADATGEIASWLSDPTVAVLEMPRELCDRALAVLRTSADAYPRSMRIVGHFTAGVLDL